jgi:flagellar biosynthesis protein FlhG
MTAAGMGMAGGLGGDQASRLRALVLGAASDGERAAGASGRAAGTTASMAGPAPRGARTIAVASGKGGVGKTTIAVNLSLALADAGVRTALVDGDLGLANADLLLGVRTTRHLGHVLDGRATLEQALTPVTERLSMLAGGSGMAALADLPSVERGRLVEAVHALESRCGAVVIDCGAGIGAGVLELAGACEQVLVVTTPEPTALADAYGLIKSLVLRSAAGDRPSLGLIVNEALSEREARDVHVRAATVCGKFLGVPLELAGWIEVDAHVPKAVRARTPVLRLFPRCGASAGVSRIAQGLRDGWKSEVGVTAGRGGGLVARLLRVMTGGRAAPGVVAGAE